MKLFHYGAYNARDLWRPYNVADGYGIGAGGYASIVPVVVLKDGSQIELRTIVEKAFEFFGIAAADLTSRCGTDATAELGSDGPREIKVSSQ